MWIFIRATLSVNEPIKFFKKFIYAFQCIILFFITHMYYNFFTTHIFYTHKKKLNIVWKNKFFKRHYILYQSATVIISTRLKRKTLNIHPLVSLKMFLGGGRKGLIGALFSTRVSALNVTDGIRSSRVIFPLAV